MPALRNGGACSQRTAAGFRQVRDEDLRVEVGAELALQSRAQVGQGGALAVL